MTNQQIKIARPQRKTPNELNCYGCSCKSEFLTFLHFSNAFLSQTTLQQLGPPMVDIFLHGQIEAPNPSDATSKQFLTSIIKGRTKDYTDICNSSLEIVHNIFFIVLFKLMCVVLVYCFYFGDFLFYLVGKFY